MPATLIPQGPADRDGHQYLEVISITVNSHLYPENGQLNPERTVAGKWPGVDSSDAICSGLTDIMCLIGVRYVQEFRVTLVQAAA